MSTAAKTFELWKEVFDHCVETPNANVVIVVGNMASYAQAARLLQEAAFTPKIDDVSKDLVCTVTMPPGCPAAGTEAKVTVILNATPEAELGRHPTLRVKL